MGNKPEGACVRQGRILQAAGRLFQHYGVQKTTVADIAREAGVGVGSVYLEFSGKDAILEALSWHRYERVLARMHAAMGADQPWADRLTGALEARTTSFLEMADGGSHASELIFCQCAGIEAAHRRFVAQEHALLEALLAEATRQGAFAVASPAATARALLHAYASTVPPRLFTRPPEETLALLVDLHTLVLRGVMARP